MNNILVLYIITENVIRRSVNEIMQRLLKQSHLWDQLSVMTHSVSKSCLNRHKCCYLFNVCLQSGTTKEFCFPTATYNLLIADKTRDVMYCSGWWWVFCLVGFLFGYASSFSQTMFLSRFWRDEVWLFSEISMFLSELCLTGANSILSGREVTASYGLQGLFPVPGKQNNSKWLIKR